MNYTCIPSLKHRALVKVAIALWHPNDIRDLLARSSAGHSTFRKNPKMWQEIDEKVKEQVQKLPLPESMRKEISDVIQPIGLEIMKWKENLDFRCRDYIGLAAGFGTELLTEICWTPQGTVDEKKTVEVLSKDESLDIATRYVLACFYCLEDDVKELWNKIPLALKEYFNSKIYQSMFGGRKIIVYWTHDIKGELTQFCNLVEDITGREISPYLFLFEHSAKHANKVATEYFWQKLTPEERDDSLVKCAKNIAENYLPHKIDRTENFIEDYFVILCFLLSQMNEEQQVKVFKNYACRILRCLLDWPWQTFFMETTNRLWEFLPKNDYEQLLRAIVYKMMDGFMDYNYHTVFEEFWQQSPDTYKNYVIGRCGSLLSDLFQIEDKENVRLILKSATVKQKEEMILSVEGKFFCQRLINSNKWDLLKFYIQECISSEDVLIKFKEEFKNHVRLTKWLNTNEDMQTKFLPFLEGLTLKDNEKTDMEEGTSTVGCKII